MNCCCTNTKNYCRVIASCNHFLRTGFNAPASGVYVLMLNFLGSVLRIGSLIEENTEIIFPTTGLNENFHYSGYIIAPDGTQLTLTDDDDNEFDCLEFDTIGVFDLGDTEIDDENAQTDLNFLRSYDFAAPSTANVFNIPLLAGKYLVSVEMNEQSHTPPNVTLNNDGDLDLTLVGGAIAGTAITVIYKNSA